MVIPVQVVPQNGLAATFDNPISALGDPVTLTAPAGITFADTANLSLGTDRRRWRTPDHVS